MVYIFVNSSVIVLLSFVFPLTDKTNPPASDHPHWEKYIDVLQPFSCSFSTRGTVKRSLHVIHQRIMLMLCDYWKPTFKDGLNKVQIFYFQTIEYFWRFVIMLSMVPSWPLYCLIKSILNIFITYIYISGHLSSASIYPACLAPYCFATACSDGVIRFWTVSSRSNHVKQLSSMMLEEDGEIVNTGKVWIEWTMVKESAIEIEGQVMFLI